MASGGVRIRGVGEQAIWLGLANGFGQVSVAVAYLLAARASEPMDFGRLVAVVALGSATASILDFGSNGYWTRELARRTLDAASFVNRAFTKVLIAAGIGIIWALVEGTLTASESWWVGPSILVLHTLVPTAAVPLRSAAMAERVALSTALDRLSVIFIMIVLLGVGVDALVALFVSLCAGAAVNVFVSGVLSIRRFGVRRVGFRPDAPWKGTKYFGLSGMAGVGLNLSLPVLAASGGGAAAGIYGSVSKVTQPLMLLAAAFSSASAPFVAHAGTLRDALAAVWKSGWMLVLGVLAAIVAALIAPLLIPWILGDAYAGAAPVLQVLCVGAAIGVVNQPLAILLQYRDRDRTVGIAMVTVVIAELIFIAVAAPTLGAMAAALAILGAQCVLVVAFLVTLAGLVRYERRR